MAEEDVSLVDVLTSFSVSVRRKYRNKVVEPLQGKQRHLRKPVAALRRTIHERLNKIDTTLSTEVNVSRTEKGWFAFSLLNIFYFGFLIGQYPRYVHIVYTTELAILIPIRVWRYYQKNMQYYLADLCYFANLLAILYVWVWPQSVTLWISCFSFSFGTLCFAVVTWRNSLVLHSIDKTTSTFIHMLPPAVFHCIHHRLDWEYKQERFPAANSLATWRSINAMAKTTLFYFLWQFLYHYFITIRRHDEIEAGRVTSFEFMRRKHANARIGKIVNGLPGPLPVIAFTMIQFTYQMLAMLPCPLWYRNEILSSIFLTIIFGIASYNGATYYIDVFGQRFHKQLLALRRELEEIDNSDNSAPSSPEFNPQSVAGNEPEPIAKIQSATRKITNADGLSSARE